MSLVSFVGAKKSVPPRADMMFLFANSYGFVPVWRLNGDHPTTIPNPHAEARQPPSGALNHLLCLPKLLASHLRSSSSASAQPPPFDEIPPALPPKDNICVTAPTPTSSPYTWAVPETSAVLEAFLSLIYPCGTFTSHPETPLSSLELTGRVVRAALGYQSAKALNIARDHMHGFVDAQPVEVYAMAAFFKFTDLARLASTRAIGVTSAQWGEDSRVLMGRSGAAKLEELQATRLAGLREILERPLEVDGHSSTCVRRGMMEDVWTRKEREVLESLSPSSELLELLAIDLRGGHCGDCLVQLGQTIQRCLYQARELPRSI